VSGTEDRSSPTAFDLTETDRLLTTTRSVRRRLDLDHPVDRTTLLDCIRIATQAPTASNAQNWHWLVIDDPATVRVVGEIYQQMATRHLLPYRDDSMDERTHRVLDGAEYLASVMNKVPAMILPCIEGRLTNSSPALASPFYGSILLAVWSLQLALRSRGLGSCFTTLHLAAERTMADALGIPDDVTQVALVPVAHTVGDDFRPARRAPVEDVTYVNRWGRRPDVGT
jgi:nitroreductase